MTGPLNAALKPPTRAFRRGFVVVYISLDSGDRVMVLAHVTGISAAKKQSMGLCERCKRSEHGRR